MFHQTVVRSVFDLEEALPGRSRRLWQLSGGPFRGTHSMLRFAGTSLHRETANARILMETRWTGSGQTVGLLAQGSSGVRLRGEWIAPGSLICHAGGPDFWMTVPEGLDMLWLTLPEGSLPVGDSGAVHPPDDPVSELASWLYGLLVRASDDGLASGADLMAIAPGLIRDRLTLLLDRRSRWHRPGVPRTERVWQRVRDRIGVLQGELLPVQDLAREIGLRPAALRAAVLEQTGCRLDEMLTIWRLTLAHRDLLEAGPDGRSVSDIAMSRGFYHLGRFASRYRDFFGERPSETRARGGVRRGDPSPRAGSPRLFEGRSDPVRAGCLAGAAPRSGGLRPD